MGTYALAEMPVFPVRPRVFFVAVREYNNLSRQRWKISSHTPDSHQGKRDAGTGGPAWRQQAP